MDVPRSIRPFVQAAIGEAPLEDKQQRIHVWDLAADPALRQQRLEAVKAGHQHATATLAWEFDAAERPYPETGDLLVFRDAALQPCAIAQVVERRVVPFDDVDELFAADSGEGDLSVRYWRDTQQPLFEALARQLGREPAMTMPVVTLRFELVYPTRIGA